MLLFFFAKIHSCDLDYIEQKSFSIKKQKKSELQLSKWESWTP